MIKLESGAWLPVDAVWKEFGTEKEFFHKKDIEPMSLYRISGFDDEGSFGKLPRRKLLKRVVKSSPAGLLASKLKNKRKIRVRAMPVVSGYYEHDEEAVGKIKLGKALKKLGKGVAKVAKKAGKGVAKTAKKVGKGVAKAAKGAVKAVVKIAATPARNAFLALVGLNFKGLGYKMNKAIVKDPNKVKDFWVKKFKGNWNSLLKAVQRGAKKGKKYTPGQIGDGGASFIAVAGPILIAAMGLLSSILGKKEAEENGDISEGVDKEMLNDKDIMEQLKDPTKLAENISTAVTAAMQASSPAPYKSGTDFDSQQYTTEPIQNDGGGESGGGGEPEEKDNTMLIVGGAAVAAALLLK
jgi:hypothetical protein